MNFEKKTWKNRISEYPMRRELTFLSDSSTEMVSIARSEGTISEPGDAFNAENMNDLEDRIEQVIQEGNSDMESSNSSINAAINSINTQVSTISNKIGGYSIRYMTKAQYNALATKDPSTLYFIPE